MLVLVVWILSPVSIYTIPVMGTPLYVEALSTNVELLPMLVFGVPEYI
jgi:hypothetical protein